MRLRGFLPFQMPKTTEADFLLREPGFLHHGEQVPELFFQSLGEVCSMKASPKANAMPARRKLKDF